VPRSRSTATGPWTRPLLQTMGCNLPIETEYHQVAHSQECAGYAGRRLRVHRFGHANLFSARRAGQFLVGDFYGQRPVDPDNFPQRASDESLGEVIERACGRVPKLENAQVMRGVTGVYDMTPDSRPLLVEIPGITGLHVCAGFSGMGFKISPAIGLVMSELVLDGVAKTVDISPFRPQRFAEGKPINGGIRVFGRLGKEQA